MPLKGIRVIEMGGLAPAPFCGMVLADFGATIIKVDRIAGAELVDCLSNGKKSLALNLKHPKGVTILRRLCKNSDVFLEPYRKGVMEKLGLGPKVLLEDNPKLVYARLTGFGQFGKYSNMAGHDINYLATSGLLSLFGRKGEKPTAPCNTVADFAGGGLLCALGIVLALMERTRSGLGQIVDSNMVEGSAYVGSWLFRSGYFMNPRGENILDSGAPFYDTYETKDGKYMAVGALESQFYSQFVRGLGLMEEDAPQFAYFKEHTELFSKRFKERTQKEWCEVFDGTDACVTPVLSLEEASKHPHNEERRSFVTTGDTSIPVPAAAPRLSRTPPFTTATQPRPNIGQHTAEILLENKYTEQEIRQLVIEGAIAINSSKL